MRQARSTVCLCSICNLMKCVDCAWSVIRICDLLIRFVRTVSSLSKENLSPVSGELFSPFTGECLSTQQKTVFFFFFLKILFRKKETCGMTSLDLTVGGWAGKMQIRDKKASTNIYELLLWNLWRLYFWPSFSAITIPALIRFHLYYPFLPGLFMTCIRGALFFEETVQP